MKKLNKKGFTLIELLAVIVILGLLMAIAIPSVTKYITQSRKKTLTTTIGNYVKALQTDVNNMEYTFTDSSKVYAVPIECIALESGGTDPFGIWAENGATSWAYVLVQYSDTSNSYTYGFTFKDSAGYGMTPTKLSNIKSSGSNVLTGLTLTKPILGKNNASKTKVTTGDFKDKIWHGLEVNGTTNVGIDSCKKINENI